MGVRTVMSRSRIIRLENLDQFQAIQVLSDPGHIGGPKFIPSCAEIRIRWTLEDGKVAHNVLTGRYTGAFAGTSAQAEAIRAALVAGATWTNLAGFLATTTALAGVDIRDLNTPGNPYISSTGASTPGTSAGTALPNEVSAVISLLTAKTGPQNRGRMYIPGWATNALGAGNVIAAGAQTALGVWSGVIGNALNAQGYQFSIGQPARAAYTGSSGTQHPARAATSIPVTNTALKDNHWDSQRRRGLK